MLRPARRWCETCFQGHSEEIPSEKSAAGRRFERREIRILLNEYSTLRQEIISRTTHGFQLISVGAVALTWLVTTSAPGPVLLLALSVLAAALLVGVWLTFRSIGSAARRVRHLEADINRRAGERLLLWELSRGNFTAHFWHPRHWSGEGS